MLWCWWWILAVVAHASLLPLEVERLHASVGGYAVMNCHLDFPFGTEIPYHLQWEKDGEVILSWYSGGAGGSPVERVADRWGGRLRRLVDGEQGLGRGSLNVTAVRETDAGLYRCRVAFPNRTPPERNNGTFYYLHVDGGDLIVTPPMNVTVLEGSRAELECRPASGDAVVQWFRDGASLQAMPELAARAELPANGSLVLRHAVGADAGRYECRVRAGSDSAAAAAFLDVQYKAKVVYAPEERVLLLGEPASLDCHFSANPPLTNLRWEKDGFLFDPYNVPGVFYSRNGSLLFNQVDSSHEGLYSCTPYNALGSAGASPAVRVRVQQPVGSAANAVDTERSLHVARLGADVALPCHDALPPITWTKKDGSALAPERFLVEGGRLSIRRVSERDRGVYVCTGAGGAHEAELRVENLPPRAPHALSARRDGSSLHLSWQPGHSGEEVSYQVWYRARGAGEWRTLKVLSRGTTSATLRALSPAAYELRVLAQDALGDGLFSKPLFVSTDGIIEETVTAYQSTTDMSEVTEVIGTGEAYESKGSDGPEESDGMDGSGDWDEPGLDTLSVSVRLLEEGALVTWRPPTGGVMCTVRWLRDDELLDTTHTTHDYVLVNGDLEEGASYLVRVSCGAARGGAMLEVPAYGRLRAVAGGCAGAALLLAAAAAAYCAARKRGRPHRPAPPPPPKRTH